MSDRIAVMLDGHVEQLADPDTIYDQPGVGVRRRVHRPAELPARASSTGDGHELAGEGFTVIAARAADDAVAGQPRPRRRAARGGRRSSCDVPDRAIERGRRQAGRHLPPRRRHPVRRDHRVRDAEILEPAAPPRGAPPGSGRRRVVPLGRPTACSSSAPTRPSSCWPTRADERPCPSARSPPDQEENLQWPMTHDSDPGAACQCASTGHRPDAAPAARHGRRGPARPSSVAAAACSPRAAATTAAAAPGGTSGGGSGGGSGRPSDQLNLFTGPSTTTPRSCSTEFGNVDRSTSTTRTRRRSRSSQAATAQRLRHRRPDRRLHPADGAERPARGARPVASIPNFENLDPLYTNQPWDPDNKYSVCKDWGSTGWIYDNTVDHDAASRPGTTSSTRRWARRAGRRRCSTPPPNVTRHLLLGQRHRLDHRGHGGPRRVRGLHGQRARAAHQGVRLVPGHQADAGQLRAVAGVERRRPPGAVSAGRRPRPSTRGASARPTTELWMDNWCIVKGAKNLDAAYDFINFILDPEQLGQGPRVPRLQHRRARASRSCCPPTPRSSTWSSSRPSRWRRWTPAR